MKIKIKATLLALAVGSLLAATPSQAANPNYAPGDLILGFQATGGTGSDKSVLVNLGNTATVFRDGTDFSSIINVASVLESVYGAGWAERGDISFGLIGVWGNAAIGNTLQNGDPLRTIYASRARTTLGTSGVANSVSFGLIQDSAMTAISNQIVGLQNYFENNFTSNTAIVTNSDTPSDWAQLVPAGGSAFGGLTGGIQTTFGSGTIGSYEGLLDLYRLQAKNDIAGQYGFGQAIRNPGEYLGSIGIDTAGNVSFITAAVPEPSTYALVGAGVVLIGLLRRANRNVKA
jgi:hypothetical protein